MSLPNIFSAPALGQKVTNLVLTGLFYESAADNLTAYAGGGPSPTLQLTAETNRIAVVATPGDSVALPPSAPGLTIIIINHGANTLQVFGAGADTIDDLTTGVPHMVNSEVIYTCTTSGSWYSNGLGTGYSGALPTVSYMTGIVAYAGGGQANATQLATVINRVTVVATASDSVRLPASAGGLQITVANAAANAMAVFPYLADAVNGAAASAVYTVAAGKTATFYCAVAGQWHAVLSA